MASSDERSVHDTITRKKSGWRWLWAVLIVAVLGVGLWFGLRPGQEKTSRFQTQPVERGDLQVTVTAVGTLQPLDEVIVSSELSGIVREVRVDTNDTVEQGQVLAVLDTQILTAQARQSHAQVEAMHASLQSALVQTSATELALTRAQSLMAAGATSQSALDEARSKHETAVAAVALAEAQLRQARASDSAAHTNLGKAQVLSPIDGVVLERNVEPGQAVVSALQAATMFRVARDLSRMTVEVELDEADVGRVKPGQSADFTVATFTDRVFDAEVFKVDLAPLSASEVVTYGAELHLDNPDLLLRPGLTATVQIATETHPSVLLVPNAALRFQPEDSSLLPPETREGRRVARVWVLVDGEPQPVEVMPVASDGRRTAVEGPLNPGEPLVLGMVEGKK